MGAYRCDTHGLQAPQAGCPHFFAAVDGGRPLEVATRWSAWGTPYLLCRDCQARVDAERGTSDASTRSDTGLDLPGARCGLHVLDWYSRTGDDTKLLSWMKSRYLEDSG